VTLKPEFDEHEWAELKHRIEENQWSVAELERAADEVLRKPETKIRGQLIVDGAERKVIELKTIGDLQSEFAYRSYVRKKVVPDP
jgi:hypothetical protein